MCSDGTRMLCLWPLNSHPDAHADAMRHRRSESILVATCMISAIVIVITLCVDDQQLTLEQRLPCQYMLSHHGHVLSSIVCGADVSADGNHWHALMPWKQGAQLRKIGVLVQHSSRGHDGRAHVASTTPRSPAWQHL